MSEAQLIADSLVSLAAVVGLLVLLGVIRRTGRSDAMTGRFRFALIVLIVMLAGRLLWWNTGSTLFLPVMLVAASLVPLAAVLLAEGLLRRHAPPLVKYALLVGTVMFILLAFLPFERLRGYGLLSFQFLGFVAAGWMVVTRDRRQLSPRENWLTDRIALSLVLILPFLITDFRFQGTQIPVRMSGIAILFICWLAVGMGRSNLGHRDTIAAFSVLALASLAGGVGIGAIAGFGFVGMVQAVAVVLCAALVAAIFIEAMNLIADGRRDSLLSHIATSTETDAAAFLHGLREHMLVEGALMLGPSDLTEFDADELRRVFAEDPVRYVHDLKAPRSLGIEQLEALFERYEVTHLMLVSRVPLTLVALNLPALATTTGAETELRAAQRVAMLISERRHAGD